LVLERAIACPACSLRRLRCFRIGLGKSSALCRSLRFSQRIFPAHKVDEKDLLAGAAAGLPVSRKKPRSGKILDAADIYDIFGIEARRRICPEDAEAASRQNSKKPRATRPTRKKKS
jgi:hypothetical protein